MTVYDLHGCLPIDAQPQAPGESKDAENQYSATFLEKVLRELY